MNAKGDPTKLKQAFDKFKGLPFPRDSYDPECSSLFADLVEYDGYIAGLIMRLLEGVSIAPYILESDTELMNRARQLASDANSPEVAACGRVYVEYLEAISQLVTIAKSCC